MTLLTQKWMALKSSERSLLMYGIPLIVMALLYFYVWQPYRHSINELRQQISYTQEDIAWLEKISRQIKQLQSTKTTSKGTFSGSFINIVDKSIKQNRLNKYIRLLEKSGNNNVVVKFDKISFDELIKFIAYLKKRYGIIVKSIDMERTDNEKLLTSRIILKKN